VGLLLKAVCSEFVIKDSGSVINASRTVSIAL
jgi:hypothetical protein